MLKASGVLDSVATTIQSPGTRGGSGGGGGGAGGAGGWNGGDGRVGGGGDGGGGVGGDGGVNLQIHFLLEEHEPELSPP